MSEIVSNGAPKQEFKEEYAWRKKRKPEMYLDVLACQENIFSGSTLWIARIFQYCLFCSYFCVFLFYVKPEHTELRLAKH